MSELAPLFYSQRAGHVDNSSRYCVTPEAEVFTVVKLFIGFGEGGVGLGCVLKEMNAQCSIM